MSKDKAVELDDCRIRMMVDDLQAEGIADIKHASDGAYGKSRA